MQVREATSLILAISTASGRLSMASAREFKTEESRPYGRSHTGYRGVPQSFLPMRSQVAETSELRAPAECVPKPCALRTIGLRPCTIPKCHGCAILLRPRVALFATLAAIGWWLTAPDQSSGFHGPWNVPRHLPSGHSTKSMRTAR
jgi:hypothetical protein